MSDATPVEVSLWTTATALMRWPASAARRSAIWPAQIGERQSPGITATIRPSRSAMRRHSDANQPVSTISTWSPGDSVLTRAASQAPVPDAG